MSTSSRSSLARLLETRPGRAALAVLALVGVWLSATPVLARGLVRTLAEQVDEAQVGEERFESPRAIGRAIYGFLEYQRGENPDGLARASQIFDLDHISAAQRGSEGANLLETRLVPILDRVQLVGDDGAPFASEADVEGLSTWTWTGHPEASPDVDVRLVFARQSDGGWRIDRDTVGRLEVLWREVRDLPRLAELEDKPVSMQELVLRWVPDRLEQGGFLLDPYQWIGLVLLLAIGFVVERVLIFVFRPALRRVTKGEGTIYEELLGDFERPVGWVIATLVFLAGLPALGIEPRYRDTLELAASVVLAFGCVWATYRLVDVFSWYLERKASLTENRFDDMLVPLVRRTLKVAVVIVGVVFVASRITTDLWGVFAGLSIGSLALGFAAKDSVENLFGTFTVLLDNPFKLGDFVKVGNYIGTVEQVGFRSTRVRTIEDTLVTMPNSRFIASDIENYSQRRRRRVSASLSVTYDTPAETIEAFCEGIRELIRRHPWTFKEGFHVWFETYGAASLDIKLIYFLETLDYGTFLREQHRMNLDVLRIAAELEVDFAFPTQTIHMAPSTPVPRTRTPVDLESAVGAGRKAADELAKRTLEPFGGARPAPVRYDPTDPDAQGPLPPRP
ncbi:MAG TPA: mechanosensitive ion channel family protein [Planctomycetota bacterium]|nr:mechanosensitive ion channel family protein [Planctomycetota bacterium]